MTGDEAGSELVRQLARALPAALDDDGLKELAAKLHPYLPSRLADGHDTRRLLTVAEVADQANVHVETVRRAIRAGELPVAARIGRSPRVSETALDRWLAHSVRGDQSGRKVRPRRARSTERPDEHSLSAALRATG